MYTNDVIKSEALRQRAYQRIGDAPPGHIRRGAIAALGVVHELASSPASAADALTLLHELQVHQVELTLQDEDLRASVAELEVALARHQRREELAPVALFCVDHQLTLVELNLAGMQLLACARDAALDHSFMDFFEAADRPCLRGLFTLRDVDSPLAHARARLLPAAGSPREVQVSASPDPSVPHGYRVAVMPIGEPEA